MDTLTPIDPGLGAFLAFFFLAVALWLLMRNMNARMRRMAYRERDRLAALEAQQRPDPADGLSSSPAPGPDPTGRNGDEGRRETEKPAK